MRTTLARISAGLVLLAGGAILAMMGITIAEIVLRRLFRSPVHGHYEIVQLCLLVTVYGGLVEATGRGAHITVDLVDRWQPELSRRVLQPAATALMILALVVLTAGAVAQAWDVARFGDTTSDLRISLLWYWGPVIVGLVGALLGCVLHGRPAGGLDVE